MKRKPIIRNLIIAILLPLLVMAVSVMIFAITCKCGDIHLNDRPNILALCSGCIFLLYVIVMWYVRRSFSFEQVFAILLFSIVGYVGATRNGFLDMGTATIAIFAEIIIMQIVTFSTIDISTKSEESQKK